MQLPPSFQNLLTTLLSLMPSLYQQRTLEAIFRRFLSATGMALPQHCQAKSAAAISRFLNHYDWPTRRVIQLFRAWVLQQILSDSRRGRRPHLQVIIDLTTLEKRGKFNGLNGAVRMVKRYVLCTRQLKASTLRWWGKRRWQLEGWFKTAKHRFSLHRFGQQTLLGVHRWLVLSLMSFVLALAGYWLSGLPEPPDWGVAARTALECFFPSLVIAVLLQEIERLRPLALELGFELQVLRCKI